MGVATGCGFKEVYRFPHTTYLVSVLFCSSIPTFFFFYYVFRSCISIYFMVSSVLYLCIVTS